MNDSVKEEIDRVFADHGLAPFARLAAWKWIPLMAAREDLARAREWLRHRVNNTKAPPHQPMQRGCGDIVPGLRAQPWWSTAEFPWVAQLESMYPDILAELQGLRGEDAFQPFRQPKWASKIEAPDKIGGLSHDKGAWNVFYLWLHEADFEENRARCPKTVEFIKSLGKRQYQHALFSALTPGSHIIPHNGPTNKKLRVHLGLCGIDKSFIRVGDETRPWETGKCMIFDDSFQHEVWHDGAQPRFVLIFDIWHPDLSDDEVKFLGFMHRSKMRAEKRALQNAHENGTFGEDGDPDFFQILEQTKGLIIDSDWWQDVQREEDNGTADTADHQESV